MTADNPPARGTTRPNAETAVATLRHIADGPHACSDIWNGVGYDCECGGTWASTGFCYEQERAIAVLAELDCLRVEVVGLREQLATAMILTEDEIRDLAVGVVDMSQGYTMEFSSDPVSHARRYDDIEHFLTIQVSLINGVRAARPVPATPEPRRWKSRPDKRWGWVSSDGYELEWRSPEGGMPRGYYLFGPQIDGMWCGTESKTTIVEWANETIANRLTPATPEPT